MSQPGFKFRSHPVDFEVLSSAMRTITLEMGITMERTSRAPIYFAAHDFSTAVFDRGGDLVALTEYIPIHICAAPFAIRAVLQYFGEDIHPGDLFLLSDPYTLDGGNHLADWTIALPVFHDGELLFWSVNRAHQEDIGGGAPGAYNPGAIDCFAEGIRIPPIKIYEGGKLRRDIFDFVLTNVRFPSSQRGDLWSMIGSARVGERRLLEIINRYGLDAIRNFLADLNEYTEALMRDEIAKVPDGTYYGECSSDYGPGGQPVTVRCQTTIKGTDMIVDLTQCDGMVPGYFNSTIANTYSSVFIGVMTSVGRLIKYRSEGCMRPVQIVTKPGSVCHATLPAPHGHCTNFVAKQIIEAVWDSLAKAIPDRTPAGWGALDCFVFAGFDPRRNEPFASPDFLSCAAGSGAIGETDGWHSGAPQICSGGLLYPEIEVCELTYPLFWKKWELFQDSGGPGKYRGGTGTESAFVNGSPQLMLFQLGDHFKTQPSPCIGGSKPPPYNRQSITRADGTEEEAGDYRAYFAAPGDVVNYWAQGGCGVGDPLERDPDLVLEDVIEGFVSVERAREDYGVVIDSRALELDREATTRLRNERR